MSIWLPGSKHSTTPTYSSKQLQLNICCSLGRWAQVSLIAPTVCDCMYAWIIVVKALHVHGAAGGCVLQAFSKKRIAQSKLARYTVVCSITVRRCMQC
jgi:hypothetical protein